MHWRNNMKNQNRFRKIESCVLLKPCSWHIRSLQSNSFINDNLLISFSSFSNNESCFKTTTYFDQIRMLVMFQIFRRRYYLKVGRNELVRQRKMMALMFRCVTQLFNEFIRNFRNIVFTLIPLFNFHAIFFKLFCCHS